MVRLASTILPTVKRLYCLLSGFWTKTFSSSSGSLWVVSTIEVGLSGFDYSSGSLSGLFQPNLWILLCVDSKWWVFFAWFDQWVFLVPPK